MHAGSHAGILVKKGQFLEESARADVVLFDKTGTLTQGSPRVDNVFPVAGADATEVLTLAASVEKNSTHPLARAVLKAVRRLDLVFKHLLVENMSRLGAHIYAAGAL
jgi:Cd2+/Zn2+-exporting ATPase